MNPEEKAANKAAWENTPQLDNINTDNNPEKPELTPEEKAEFALFEQSRRIITSIMADPEISKTAYRVGPNYNAPLGTEDNITYQQFTAEEAQNPMAFTQGLDLDDAKWSDLFLMLTDKDPFRSSMEVRLGDRKSYEENKTRDVYRKFVLKERGIIDILDHTKYDQPPTSITDHKEKMAALNNLYEVVNNYQANMSRDDHSRNDGDSPETPAE